jgi:hypothetical protein
MIFQSVRLSCVSCALLAFASACSGRGPSAPSASVAGDASSLTASSGGALVGPLSTGSVTTPRLLLPATNTTIPNTKQPVTLVVLNALVTKPGGTTYTFEIARDVAFGTKVQTKDGVAEGSGGQTSVTLDALAAATDYYWHARATSGGTTGVFSAPFRFTVGPAITINAPVPIAPLNGAQTDPRPALRVTNAVVQGPAGVITYKFEISTVSTFASILVTGTKSEGLNETGFVPTSDLPSTGTLFWRATAMDAANGVTSAPSAVQSFTANKPSQASIVAAKLGVVLWPGVQPPGSVGHATMGNDWNVEPIVSFSGVVFINPPLNELQVFDLLDRGFDPPGAIEWMHANGYPDAGLWYPDPGVIAFVWEYMALINGRWDIIIRVGA